MCGNVLNPHRRHLHCNPLVKSPTARSLQVHVEVSCKNQLCPHCPLHHRHRHIPNLCVGKRSKVTVGPVALSCVLLYRPAMVGIVVAVIVVAVFVKVVAVIVFGAGRPLHGPLPPCHPPNGENTKA